MDWSTFSGIIACAGSDELFGLVLQEKVCKPAAAAGIEISLLTLSKDELLSGEGFIHLTSWFNFYIREGFITCQGNDPLSFTDFISLLAEVFAMTPADPDPELPDNMRYATYAFNFLLADGKEIRAQLHAAAAHELESRSLALFGWVQAFFDPANLHQTDWKKFYAYDDRHFYASYRDEGWQLVDPLHDVAQLINRGFRAKGDQRLHKPDIILQEDNLNRRHTFSNLWVLSADHLSTAMERPNDVSLYASICERNLTRAKLFYDATFPDRQQYQIGNFPDPDIQRDYVDYFENITTAALFSYTAIEAFTNSFIPDGYQIVKPSGKIVDKAKIERTFPLVDKLKEVMRDVYATPDPEQEAWWQCLSELQEIRDQTIHTKQHLSKDRYSKLLSQGIFEIITVYEAIIRFYGGYILAKDRYLINEFPYGFGYDDVYPSLMSDRTYKDIYNSLHNPSRPL